MTALPLTLIAAVARNGVIGQGNRMPWRLPGEMAHFRASTMGKPVLIGRRTFEAIGGPLPGRPLVVVSRDAGFDPGEGAVAAANLGDAVRRASDIGTSIGATEIMVAGGGTVYVALLPYADKVLLTEVDLEPEGDTHFPVLDPSIWQIVERQDPGRVPGDDASYAFLKLVRRHTERDRISEAP